MRPRVQKCLVYRVRSVAEARSETQVKVSSPAKAGDPVSECARSNARPRSTGYPAFAGYDENQTNDLILRSREAASRRMGHDRTTHPSRRRLRLLLRVRQQKESTCSIICRKSLVAFSIG